MKEDNELKRFIRAKREDYIRTDGQFQAVRQSSSVVLARALIGELLSVYELLDILYDNILEISKYKYESKLMEKVKKLEEKTKFYDDEGIQWVIKNIKQEMEKVEKNKDNNKDRNDK